MLLMSIKPKYAYEILKGNKKYELRKKCNGINYGTKVIIYATSKVKAIVGEFKVGRVYKMKVKELWNFVKDHAGVTKEEFDNYFKRSEYGYAIEILDPITYNTPLSLATIREELNEPKWMPPFSYCRINEDSPLFSIITKHVEKINKK